MKKIIVILIILFCIYGCSYVNKIDRINSEIELDNSSCKIIRDKDTHGGFLGDGDYFAELKCKSINYEKLASNWKELPLSSSLEEILNVKQCGDRGCLNVFEKYSIPNIENGYYYCVDRHSESIDKYDSTDINNRSSWNFTLAILDKESNTVYFYKLDT